MSIVQKGGLWTQAAANHFLGQRTLFTAYVMEILECLKLEESVNIVRVEEYLLGTLTWEIWKSVNKGKTKSPVTLLKVNHDVQHVGDLNTAKSKTATEKSAL